MRNIVIDDDIIVPYSVLKMIELRLVKSQKREDQKDMDTSYFASYKRDRGISIALKTPHWFKGPSYPDLFPTPAGLYTYRTDHDEQAYIKTYYKDVLDKLDPRKVYTDLQYKVLLCYEKRGVFCHRHIVADWLYDKLGVLVLEL